MKSKRLRYCLYAAVAILLIVGGVRLFYALTDDFRLANMTYDMTGEPVWQVAHLPQEEKQALRILQQNFYYIGKGAQTYVFRSEDGKYVLKFFKFKHLKPFWGIYLLPPMGPLQAYKEKIISKKRRQLHRVFKGYLLGFEENREHAGLLYMHLNPTHHLKQTVTVLDKMGWTHAIALDDVVFLLQKKGETLESRVTTYLKQGDVQKVRQALSQILDMYVAEYRKGIYDRDHGVMSNTGFVEDQPFHLDVGMLARHPSIHQKNVYKKDLEHVLWMMHQWFKHHYPDYKDEFKSFIAEQFHVHTGEDFDIKLLDKSQFKGNQF